MKRIPKIHQFSYPCTAWEKSNDGILRPSHKGDLVINFTAFTLSDGSLLRDDKNDPEIEINWCQWKEELVTEIFIKDFLPELHAELIAAAKAHAHKDEQILPIPVENNHDADELNGIWMADQAERALYDHEQNM